MKSAAIIGAGITGLTAGFYLQKAGIPVVIYEASDRPGGAIRSIRKESYLAECGPNTILETCPEIPQLIQDAGLVSRRLYTDSNAEARYVVRDRKPVAMPAHQLGIFTSPLLGWKSKWALLREPFVAPRRDGAEESLADFVTRRLSREFLDRLVDALAAGIYAGDPARLSITHAFPRLKALEDQFGSLIKGQMALARRRKKTGEVARDRAPKFSFDEGLEVLPATLAARLKESLQLSSPVQAMTRSPDGTWQVLSSRGTTSHQAILYCGTGHQLPSLGIHAPAQLDVSVFSEIRYPPVSSVVLGFRRADVAHACSGFGMLIPRMENFRILGTLFSSSLFPNRAPEGHVLLTSYVGGERFPELAGRTEGELVDIVCEDLKILLGIHAPPVFKRVSFHPKAIPQYNVGHGRFKAQLDSMENRAPGLFFAGHFRDGVSLGDSIAAGVAAARRVQNFFS